MLVKPNVGHAQCVLSPMWVKPNVSEALKPNVC